MALPSISPYSLPAVSELPRGRVNWRPERERLALLVHDMQRYFVEPYEGSPLAETTANIASLVGACRARGVPVFYTAQPGRQHPDERGLLTEFWGDGIGSVIDTDPTAADIVAPLAPTSDDEVLVKWRYSAFQHSDFAEKLERMRRDQLLITGVYAHIGCQATAVDAFMRDIRPFLVSDAVADFSRERHDQACAYVAQRCGAVTSTAELEMALSAETAQEARS